VKHICIKLVSGEELIGTTESDLESETVINIDNPLSIVQVQTQSGQALSFVPFMPYSSETLYRRVFH